MEENIFSDKSIADRLKRLRDCNNLSQDGLRTAAGLTYSQTTISKWENGTNRVPYDALIKLSRFYNVSLDALITGEDFAPAEPANEAKKEHTFRDVINALFLLDELFNIKIDILSHSNFPLSKTDNIDCILSFAHCDPLFQEEGKEKGRDNKKLQFFLNEWGEIKEAEDKILHKVNVEQIWRKSLESESKYDSIISPEQKDLSYIPISEHCKEDTALPFT